MLVFHRELADVPVMHFYARHAPIGFFAAVCASCSVAAAPTPFPPAHDIVLYRGETLLQLALDGVGIARVGNFGIGRAIAQGRLIPLLEPFNPGDREVFHAVFMGGANLPTRIRLFVDYLAEHYGETLAEQV